MQQQDGKKVIASRLHKSKNGEFRILCVPVSKDEGWDESIELVSSKAEFRGFELAVCVMRGGDVEKTSKTESNSLGERLEENKGFEGLGDMILKMLTRYRIDHVFVAVIIQGFSLLRAVEYSVIEPICCKLKEFLLELYSSLVEFRIINVQVDDMATYKHFDLPLPPKGQANEAKNKQKSRISKPKDFEFRIPVIPKVRNDRPNNVFSGKFHPQKDRPIDDLSVQKSVIENSLRVKAQEIERCAQLLEDGDFSQIRSLGKFHNYDVVRKVFQLIMVLNNISPENDVSEFVEQFDIKGFVRYGNVNMVNPEKMATISTLLKESQGLNYETVKSFNKKFGILFQYILSLVRCYDLNLRYAVILHQIEEKRVQKSQSLYLPSLEPQKQTQVPTQLYDFPGLPPPPKNGYREPYFSRDIRERYNAHHKPDLFITREK